MKKLIALLMLLCMLPVCAWAQTVKITYVANNGTGAFTERDETVGGEFETLAADFFAAPAGQKFYCWLVQTEGMVDQLEPGVMVDVFPTHTTITADWVDVNVEMLMVTIDPGEGTLKEGVSETVDAARGKDALLPPWAVVEPPAGKMFYAWDVDGVVYPGGGVYKNLQKNLTLKAMYVAEETRIAEVGFHANGGTGSMNAVGVELGESYTLPACEYTAPAGMQFKAWNVNGTEYAPGAQIVVDNGLTVMAVWEALPQYAVTFDGNGATEGTMASSTVQSGDTYMLPWCDFVREGHNFAGWLINGEGTLKQPYDEITVTADTKVVASWDAHEYIIHFSAGIGEDGNNSAGANLEKAYGAGFALADPSEFGFTCKGHEFIGWQDQTNGPNESGRIYAAGEEFVPKAFTILVAQWKPLEYKVTFKPGDGSGEMADGVATYGYPYNLPECTFTAPEGYEFKAWLMNGQETPVGTSLLAQEDTTVTALWQIKTYTVTYQTGDGMGFVRPVEDVPHGQEISLAEPPEVDERWAFDGWEIDGRKYAPGQKITITGDVTVYAEWKIRDVKITYENDEGETLLADDSLVYGKGHRVLTLEALNAQLEDTKKLTAPEGLEFGGWLVLNTRNEVIDTAKPGDDLPVYSIWKLRANWVGGAPVLCTVSFNANGGSGVMTDMQVEKNGKLILPACGFTARNESFEFIGWLVNGEPAAAGAEIIVTDSMTIDAQWRVKTCRVTLDPGAGEGRVMSDNMYYGDEFHLYHAENYDYTYEGHAFIGWNDGMKTYQVGETYTLTKDVTFTAQWEDAKYTVSFEAGAGTGEMKEAVVAHNAKYTLPACGFTAPQDKRFKAWSVNGKEYAPGAQIVVTGDTSVQAVWEDVKIYTLTFVDSNDSSKPHVRTVRDDEGFVLPTAADCSFAPVSGQSFAYWQLVAGNAVEQLDAGTEFTRVSANLTFTAMWKMNEKTETRVEQKSMEELTAEEEAEMLEDMPPELDSVKEIVTQLTIAAVKEGFEEEKVEVRDVTLEYSIDGGDTWIPATEENFPTAGITIALELPEGTNATDYEFVVTHMFTVDSERLGTTAGETETPEVTIRDGKIVVTLTGLSPVSVSWKEKPIIADLPKTGDASCLMGWIALLGASGAGLVGMKRRKK